MTNLHQLMQPQSVAIIGASADASKTAGRPVAYLQKHGFLGRIYPVNPKATTIAGLPCYPSIEALPEAPDVAIVLLGASRAAQALESLAQKGTAFSIVLASGFAEVGQEGIERQKALTQSQGGMRVLGPNTIGLVNVTDGISLSASGALEMDAQRAGHLGMVSQSGGILGSVLSRGISQGVGFSKLISTGNEADLELADFIDYLVDDPATQVISLYLETIRNPESFRRACARAHAAGKPIVAYKVGRSEAGARAATSHTGAMAGSDTLYDALFEATGVFRAQTFNDLLDLSATCLAGRELRGRRIAVLTSTGGAGTLIADNLGVLGFEVPAPDAQMAQALRELQSGDAAALDRNPIDVTLAGLDPVLLRAIIRTVLAGDAYDGLAVVVGSSSLAMPALVADAIGDSLSLTDKPILAYVSPHAPNVLRVLRERNIPAFTTPEACASACDVLLKRSVALNSVPLKLGTPVSPNLGLIANRPAGNLTEHEAAELMASFGLPFARSTVVQTAKEAQQACADLVEGLIGDSGTHTVRHAVLKLVSKTITHKSDVGGVALNQTTDTIGEALTAMQSTLQALGVKEIDGFLVQQQFNSDVELIIGAKQDPLGTVILVGTGGRLAELLQDTAIMVLPTGHSLSPDAAKTLLQRVRVWQLLQGYRGKPSLDIGAVISTLVTFSEMVALLNGRFDQAEINPLLVFEQGQGVIAVDAVMSLYPH